MYRAMVGTGLSRLYDPSLTPMKAEYPKSVFEELQYTADGSYFDAVLAEYDGLVPLTNRARPRDDFGDKPTIVIQAGKTWDASELPESIDPAKIAAGWPELQKETAALSTRGRYVVVEHATHMSLIYDEAYANQAADFIRELLNTAR
jgi:hypothetical protein